MCRFSQEAAQAPDVAVAEERADHDGPRVVTKRHGADDDVRVPVVRPALDDTGTLTFSNAAVDAGVAAPPAQYRARWLSFDNTTGETAPVGETTASLPRLAPPETLPQTPGTFVQVDITAEGGSAAWGRPVNVWFKKTGEGWRWVGLTRQP